MILAQAQLAEISRPWPEYILTGAMLVTALLMFRTSAQVTEARKARRTGDSPILWAVSAMIFIAFALVKGLNLLAFVGVWLRELTRADGVYDGRRPIQLLALSVIGMLAFIGIAAMIANRSLAHRHRLLLACIAILGLFGLMRFVSLHDVDAVLREHMWIRPAVELPFTLIAAWCALAAGRRVSDRSERVRHSRIRYRRERSSQRSDA